MVKVIFHTLRNFSKRKKFAPRGTKELLLKERICSQSPSGSKFFPFREVPILKRDAIEENHCLIQ